MIAVDSSELRANSRLNHIENMTECSFLEERTGADILVSPAELPLLNEQLLRMHLEQGAILAQRKSGRDFVESCHYRTKVSITKMHQFGARRNQCWILATGIFVPNSRNNQTLVGTPTIHDDGNITFKWEKSSVRYSALVTARRRFLMRGAIVDFLSCDEEVPGWCLGMEQDLIHMRENPSKEIYPESSKFTQSEDSPFQELKMINDQRSVLAAFRGVGPKKVSQLWDTLYEWNRIQMPLDRGWTEKDWEPNLVQMLHWASMSEEERKQLSLPKISLWGEKTRREVAEQLGLEKDEYLTTRKEL